MQPTSSVPDGWPRKESTHCFAGNGPVALDIDGWPIGLGIYIDTGVDQHIAGTTALACHPGGVTGSVGPRAEVGTRVVTADAGGVPLGRWS